jgi:hypothetical protein
MHPKAVLALNEELRKDRRPFALPDHSGHVAFQMSTLEYFYWTMRIPDLAASDAQGRNPPSGGRRRTEEQDCRALLRTRSRRPRWQWRGRAPG